MLMTEYDYATDLRVHEEEAAEIAFEQGMQQGSAKSKLEAAVIAVKDFNVSPELVAQKYNVPLADLQSALTKLA